MNRSFSHIYRHHCPVTGECVADNIDALKNQIDTVKDGMVQNIENLLERGEKIELLVDKTGNSLWCSVFW